MRLLVDTDRFSDFGRGVSEVVHLLEMTSEVFLPFIVLGELRAGFSAGRRGVENERLLMGFLRRPGVSPLFADDQTTRHYAAVYRQLRHQGSPIPANDIWIAALALQHSLVLYSRDGDFEHLPQLQRI